MSEEKIEISKELLSEIIGSLLAKGATYKIGGDSGMGGFLSDLDSDIDINILFCKLHEEHGEDDDTFATVDKDAHAYAQRIEDVHIKSYLAESADFLLNPPVRYDFDQLYHTSKEMAEVWEERSKMTDKELAGFLESHAVKETIQTNSRKAFNYLQNVKDFESRLDAFKRKLGIETSTPF